MHICIGIFNLNVYIFKLIKLIFPTEHEAWEGDVACVCQVVSVVYDISDYQNERVFSS